MIAPRCWCGCSADDPCRVFGVPCIPLATEHGQLCSACAPIAEVAASLKGRAWVREVVAAAQRNAHDRYVPCEGSQRWELALEPGEPPDCDAHLRTAHYGRQ